MVRLSTPLLCPLSTPLNAQPCRQNGSRVRLGVSTSSVSTSTTGAVRYASFEAMLIFTTALDNLLLALELQRLLRVSYGDRRGYCRAARALRGEAVDNWF